mmetsp:Transcript_104301/g.336328  ORF Transcript_104301/g.336328 Transcript_104301/m.336328 type:complete len:245 (+) Transcript_104301:69-803(+)
MAGPDLKMGTLCILLCAALGRAAQLRGPVPHKAGRQHQIAQFLREPKEGMKCSSFPELCQAPFDCHLPPPTWSTIATADGHANWRAWCGSPSHAMAARECQRGNLTGYATLMHQVQKTASAQELDAHYCFAFGHCDDFNITEKTTLQEAEAMCDAKFGHSAWTQLTKLDSSILDVQLSWGGFHMSKRAERSTAMMACAMGNYHCDAIYCQQTYCKRKDYRIRFGAERPARLKKLHGVNYPRQMS